MKTKGITEGAIFCAIAVLLSLVSYFVPFLILLTFFIPIPMIVLGKRQGLKVSILSSIAAAFLIGILLGPIIALQFGLLLLWVGCSLGVAYQKNLSAMKKLIIGVIGFSIFMIFIILSYQLITGINFVSSITEYFEMASKEALKLYENSGLLDGTQITDLEGLMDTSMKMVMMSIPTTFILLPVFLSLANVFIADLILKHLNYPVKSFKKLKDIRVPNHLKVVLTLLVLFSFMVSIFKIEIIPEIYIVTIRNLVYLVFFVMGLACIFDFLSFKKIKSKIVKVLIVLVSMLLQTIVIFLGIMDTYLDIRKLFRREM